MRLEYHFRTAMFLVVALILLASPILSACKDSIDNESTSANTSDSENSTERLPVIFIPASPAVH